MTQTSPHFISSFQSSKYIQAFIFSFMTTPILLLDNMITYYVVVLSVYLQSNLQKIYVSVTSVMGKVILITRSYMSKIMMESIAMRSNATGFTQSIEQHDTL